MFFDIICADDGGRKGYLPPFGSKEDRFCFFCIFVELDY